MALPKIPNHPDNYMSPSALSIWFAAFQDDGSLGAWFDLGNVFDIALTFTEERLDHESARSGLLAKDKSVISKVEGQVKFTIDELVGCNLLLLFRPRTTPDEAAVYNAFDQKRFRLSGTTAEIIDTFAVDCDDCPVDLAWAAAVTDVLVRSADGQTIYVSGVDYTFTQASGTGTACVAATIARINGGAIADGAEVMVTYSYDVESTMYEIQEGAIMEGAMRVQALNRIGPLFAWSFPLVSIGIDGDFAMTPGEYQKQSFACDILTDGEGKRGQFHLFDCFQKLSAASAC